MLCNRLARIAVALVCVYPILSQNVRAQNVRAKADPAHSRHLDAPLSFEANQGQADQSVQFLARGADYHLMLSRSGIVLRLGDQDHASAQPADITMIWYTQVSHQCTEKSFSAGKSNDFVGNDPSRWVTNVANYGRVRYRSVYPGTDLVFYGNQGLLEYDFRLESGADPRKIQFAISGAEPRVNGNGDLTLNLRRRDHLAKTCSLPNAGRKKREVACAYDVSGSASDSRSAPTIGPLNSSSTRRWCGAAFWRFQLRRPRSSASGPGGRACGRRYDSLRQFPNQRRRLRPELRWRLQWLNLRHQVQPRRPQPGLFHFCGRTGGTGSIFYGLAVDAQETHMSAGTPHRLTFPTRQAPIATEIRRLGRFCSNSIRQETP